MDQIIEWNNKLLNAPAGVIVGLVCIALGYVGKMTKPFPNRFIPAAVMACGSILFTLLTWQKGIDVPTVTRNACIGFFIGFVSWLVHRLIIKRFEQKLGLFVGDSFNTAEIVNPNPKPKDPDENKTQ
jgi:hypothetical protein